MKPYLKGLGVWVGLFVAGCLIILGAGAIILRGLLYLLESFED